jgi:hypothetical protein
MESEDRTTATSSGVTKDVTEWATESARSTILARQVSSACFWLAGAAVLLGVVIGLAFVWDYAAADEIGASVSLNVRVLIVQALNPVADALLPAGLLIAAGSALRLMAARFETELYDDDDDSDDDSDSDEAPTDDASDDENEAPATSDDDDEDEDDTEAR